MSKYQFNISGTTIEVTVTASAVTADTWVRQITALHSHSAAVVGLDIEWRPNYHKPATLQLCIGQNCLILQLCHMDALPQSLYDFLRNPNFTFAGVEVDEDLQKLKSVYGMDCRHWVEVRDAAREWWVGRYQSPGLKDLALMVCGLRIEKPSNVTRSNWDSRELTVEQIEYACADAYASYKIGHALLIEK